MTVQSVIHRTILELAETQILELDGFAMGGAGTVPPSVVHVAPARDGTHRIEVWYRAWVGAPDHASPRRVRFNVVGTGHPYQHAGQHAGTVLIGPYVWHVFVEYPIRDETDR